MVSQTVPLQAIDTFVTEQMERGQTPGLGIVVRQNGETVLSRGYGFADLESQTPMTEHTPVVIGSTTKAMTATAIMQLVEAGRVALDDPVRRYVPSFRLADEDAANRITIRQILTHTAGLSPTPSDWPPFFGPEDEGPDAMQEYIDELADAELIWPPGSGWLYANDGFVLAGLIIQNVSSMSYEDYMRSHLFEPLGMTESTFPLGSPPEETATPYDYGPDGKPYPSFFPRKRGSNPAGMFLSTAHDAGIWLQAVLDGGRANGRQVVSPAGIAETTQRQAQLPQASAGRIPEGWYGLGWSIGEMNGLQIVAHGGSAITMGSQFILVPAERLAVAVVANSGTEVTPAVAEGIASLMCGREPRRSFPQVDRSYQPDRSLWPRLAGTYITTQPQNAFSSLVPIEYDGTMVRALTYPGSNGRRPGDVFFAPTGNLSFVLYGRGKTGGTATFEVDSSGVRATIQGAPLVKIASRLHGGGVTRWTREERTS